MSDPRPGSIIAFERLFATTIVMQAGYVILAWLRPGGWLEQIPDMNWWRLFYIVLGCVGGMAIHIILLVFAARRASEIARALVGILLPFRLLTVGRFLWAGGDPISATGILMLLALSFHALATLFMCRGDANVWYSRRWKKVDPGIFE